MTRINSDGTARVTEDQAHAWVEYYLPDMGWVTLEATPSVGWEPPVETDKPTQPVTRPTTPSRPAPSTTEPSVSLQLPTANEPPTQPTHPSMTPGTDTPSKPGWLDAVVQGLLITVLALGSIIGQWQLRLYLRSRWLSHGSTNIQALRRWRWARRLAKLRRQDAPAALKELAQKAKFSQHTISREELAAFDGYFARSMAHLKSRNLFLRLAYRLISAAY